MWAQANTLHRSIIAGVCCLCLFLARIPKLYLLCTLRFTHPALHATSFDEGGRPHRLLYVISFWFNRIVITFNFWRVAPFQPHVFQPPRHNEHYEAGGQQTRQFQRFLDVQRIVHSCIAATLHTVLRQVLPPDGIRQLVKAHWDQGTRCMWSMHSKWQGPAMAIARIAVVSGCSATMPDGGGWSPVPLTFLWDMIYYFGTFGEPLKGPKSDVQPEFRDGIARNRKLVPLLAALLISRSRGWKNSWSIFSAPNLAADGILIFQTSMRNLLLWSMVPGQVAMLGLKTNRTIYNEWKSLGCAVRVPQHLTVSVASFAQPL